MTPDPNTIQIPEQAILGLAGLILAVWGFRCGLDAVLIAAVFVVFGRLSISILAIVVSTVINIFYGLFDLFASGTFSPDALFGVIGGNPDVAKQLINIRDPQDSGLLLIGTILFVLIGYVGLKVATSQAGGKDSFIEQVFGGVGGAAMGYLAASYIVSRQFTFPQVIEITSSEVPEFTVNAPLIIAIIVVLIVFGIQRSRPPAKKKPSKNNESN
jgi:hypothetical protein